MFSGLASLLLINAQKHLHLGGGNASLYTPPLNLSGIYIHRPKLIQHHAVISRFMAVPGHQDRIPWPCQSADSAQNPACASIYHKIRLFRSIDPGRPLHGFPQNSSRPVQVIKSFNLRNIHRKRVRKRSYPQSDLSFVPWHVERICVRSPIPFKLPKKSRLLCPF